MLFNLDLILLTIIFYNLFLFFSIIDLYFLILAAAIAQIFYPTAELVIPIGQTSKKAKVGIEIISSNWRG